MRQQLPLKSGSGRSKPVSVETLVNLYPEKAEEGAKSRVTLHGTPGLTAFAVCGDGPVRGMHKMSGVLYVVSGSKLYSVDAFGVVIDLGNIDGGSRVSMADNGTQLCVVNGASGYIYSVAVGLVRITDPDFPGALSVAFLDGYFIFNSPDGAQFFVSALYDGTDIDALDFATAESNPDPLLKVLVDHRELWLFGDDTVEIWQNVGAADFPFARISGAINEKGISAKESAVQMDNSVVWLDQDGIVRRAADGYTPVRISTHAVEYQISKGNYTAAEAFTYSQEGHEFYVLTVPGSGTFVYDAATQVWHERKSYRKDRWRASTYVRVYNKSLVGDAYNGNIYVLDLDSYTENGDPLISEMIFPPLENDGDRFTLHSFQLDMETGVGGQTSPQVMLQISRDGKVWGNEAWRSFGKDGDYLRRVIWRRLGQHRTAHIKCSISDGAKRGVYAAYIQGEPNQ